MRTVYKYNLEVKDGPQTITMPDFIICHLAMQGNRLCLWADVDTESSTRVRTFQVYGTGHEINGYRKYIGTVHAGPFVWHVFEATEPLKFADVMNELLGVPEK